MRKFITIIGLIGASFILSGCPSAFQKSINNDLKIPYAYIPPNNAYHPFTLLQYTNKGGFQQICEATTITGITNKEIMKRTIKSDLASIGVKKNHKVEYNIALSKNEIGNADSKYISIKKVEISFENGQLVSIPSVHVSVALKNIESTKCKNDIKLFSSEIPNSEFYIPTAVFSYDMKYRIIDENGINVTAELPKKLSKIILGKIGINYESNSDFSMTSKNLYIGFRGLPIKASLKSILRGGKKKFFIANINSTSSDTSLKNTTLDVTDIVQRILKK